MTKIVSSLGHNLKECAHPPHLLRTATIALVVGSWLTLFNQGNVLLTGRVSEVILLKVLLDYLTPFVVANLGLLSSERRSVPSARAPSGKPRRPEGGGQG